MGSFNSKINPNSETDALLAECATRLPWPVLKIIAQKYAESYYSDFYYVKKMMPFDIKKETDLFGNVMLRKVYLNILHKEHYIIQCDYYSVFDLLKGYIIFNSQITYLNNVKSDIMCCIEYTSDVNVYVYNSMNDADLNRLIKIAILLIYNGVSTYKSLDLKEFIKYKLHIRAKKEKDNYTTTIQKALKL